MDTILLVSRGALRKAYNIETSQGQTCLGEVASGQKCPDDCVSSCVYMTDAYYDAQLLARKTMQLRRERMSKRKPLLDR